MSINDRFFCDAATAGFVSTFNECAFKPSETKRVFLAKKGVKIETASTNLNDLTYWEGLIASGDIVPLPDGSFTDVSPNPQEGTVGTKTIKISDGETAFSWKASLVPCFLEDLAVLENNNSAFDMFIITALGQLIGKYDAANDIISPITVNSIDVRSKPLVNDGTAVEQIQDTIIIRYNEAESKKVRYFDIVDSIANVTGLRAVLIGNVSNDPTTVTIKVVTECEGVEVNDLSDANDFKITDKATGAAIAISGNTPQGSGGIYVLDATLTATETYLIEVNEVGSNNESFSDTPTEYTAV